MLTSFSRFSRFLPFSAFAQSRPGGRPVSLPAWRPVGKKWKKRKSGKSWEKLGKAAKAGAEFVSPFVGRLDDTKIDGVGLIKEIRTIYDNYSFRTKILAASIRSLEHIKNCAIAGAEAVTAPPAILRELVSHPLTDKGLEIFLSDWEKSNQKI